MIKICIIGLIYKEIVQELIKNDDFRLKEILIYKVIFLSLPKYLMHICLLGEIITEWFLSVVKTQPQMVPQKPIIFWKNMVNTIQDESILTVWIIKTKVDNILFLLPHKS